MTATSAPAPLSVAVATDGDADFVALYTEHYGRLVSSLRLAGADGPNAEDTAQEAFARTFARWHRVRRGSSPAGYVYRTAFRLLRRRGGLPETPLDDHTPAVEGPEAMAVVGVGVRAALAAMPPRRRACAALCLYLDWSPEEAADALGIAAATVRVQVHRARRQLVAALEEDPPESTPSAAARPEMA